MQGARLDDNDFINMQFAFYVGFFSPVLTRWFGEITSDDTARCRGSAIVSSSAYSRCLLQPLDLGEPLHHSPSRILFIEGASIERQRGDPTPRRRQTLPVFSAFAHFASGSTRQPASCKQIGVGAFGRNRRTVGRVESRRKSSIRSVIARLTVGHKIGEKVKTDRSQPKSICLSKMQFTTAF